MPRYTLRELRDAALEECPEAFQLFSDVSKFTLERRVVARADRPIWEQDEEQLVIHLAFYHTSMHNDRVYAAIDFSNSKIAIYHGKPGDSLSPVHKLFPNPEKMQNSIVKFVKPFDLAIEHPLLKSNDVNRRIARKERRFRTVLLAQWAFLLAGQTNYIEHAKDDLLREFVSLCMHLQRQSQQADARALQASEEESGDSITNESMIDNMINAQSERTQQNNNYAGSLFQGDLKRKMPIRVTDVSEDESYTPPTTRRPYKMQRGAPTSGRSDRNVNQGHQLAMRPSPSPGVGPSSRNAALPSPPRANKSIADVKGFLDDQAQKIDELERELHAEKQKTSELEKVLHAEKQKVHELKKTVVAENKKTQDAQQEETTWKEKHENLVKWREEAKASLNNFMRDDSESR